MSEEKTLDDKIDSIGVDPETLDADEKANLAFTAIRNLEERVEAMEDSFGNADEKLDKLEEKTDELLEWTNKMVDVLDGIDELFEEEKKPSYIG